MQPVPASKTRVESAPILPVGGAPFALHVVLAEGEAAAGGPFLLLSEEEDAARVYLAVVKGDDDSVVDFAALKLTPNAYAPSLSPDAALHNPELEARWTAEASCLRRLTEASASVPRSLRPGGEIGERFPPLLFCRVERRFFTPPCPKCGAPLATCRDDARLAAAGLPLYSASRERFLSCASCSGKDGPATFYAFEPPPDVPEGAVSSAQDLYRDLGEALAGSDESSPEVAESFPCEGCREAGRQFRTAFASGVRAAPFWEGRWVPLNFYDSPYLLTALGQLSLDEFADWIGGRRGDSFLAEKTPPRALAMAARLRHPVGLESEGRLLFAADGSGLDAVEIFYLKMAAFQQVARAVLEYHRTLGRPHLDLHPRHVLFDLSAAGDGLPPAWSFRARLHGLSSAASTRRIAGTSDVLVPPASPAVPYAAPELLEFHLTPARPAQLVLTEFEPGAGSDRKSVRLHGRLSDPYGVYPDPSPRDWILTTLENETIAPGAIVFAARRDPRVTEEAQEVHFVSEPISLEEAVLTKLKRAAGVRIPGARYKVYADFGAPTDLFSLGMLLLRILVGNDRQDVRKIQSVVEKISKHLSSAGETTLGNILGGAGASPLLERDPDVLEVLKRSSVFHPALDREPQRPNAIPDALWKAALLLGLRLCTRIPGFSICVDPSDYDPAHPTEKIEQTLNEAERIAAELKGLLFSRQGIHLEIQQVLAELLSETGGDPGARPSARG